MSVIIDVVLVAVIIFCAFYYMKKGFVSSLIGMFRFWIALAVAFLFSSSLADRFQSSVEEHLMSEGNESIASKIGDYFVSSGFVARVLAFAVIFIIVVLALKLVEILLNMFFNLPVLKSVNRAAGFLCGLIIGLLWLQVLSLIFLTVAEYLVGTTDWLTAEAFNNTMIASKLYQYNIFKVIFNAIIK